MTDVASSSASVDGFSADEPPLLRIIDAMHSSERDIVGEVATLRAEIAARTGLTGPELRSELAREIIDRAAEKSALIAAGAALPLSLPGLGPLLTTLLVVPSGVVWVSANEVALCYALACACEVDTEWKRLRLVNYWLVRMSNYDELQAKALTVGVRLTVRKVIEKLVAASLTRAFASSSARMMAGMMGPSLTPWYASAASFLGVPVLTVLAWRSTQSVGQRAIAYFDEPGTRRTGDQSASRR